MKTLTGLRGMRKPDLTPDYRLATLDRMSLLGLDLGSFVRLKGLCRIFIFLSEFGLQYQVRGTFMCWRHGVER